jgi:hypothetical protein
MNGQEANIKKKIGEKFMTLFKAKYCLGEYRKNLN